MSTLSDLIEQFGCVDTISDREFRAIVVGTLCKILESQTVGVIPACFKRIDGTVDPISGLVVLRGYIIVSLDGPIPAESFYTFGQRLLDPAEFAVVKCC